MGVGSALSGTLDELPLGELLAFLAATSQTGVIEFAGRSPGVIVLHDGAVTVALSENGPTLQQVFIGSGITDADGWWDASAEARRSGSLCDAVIAAGADPVRVEQVLHDQTLGAIFELVLPSKDRFEFQPGATHPLGHRFHFDHTELLAEAERRVEAWKVIAESVPSTSLVMVPVRRLSGEAVTVSAGDWELLALLDGRRTVADIIRELGMSAFGVCATVHGLRQAGLVEPVGST